MAQDRKGVVADSRGVQVRPESSETTVAVFALTTRARVGLDATVGGCRSPAPVRA